MLCFVLFAPVEVKSVVVCTRRIKVVSTRVCSGGGARCCIAVGREAAVPGSALRLECRKEAECCLFRQRLGPRNEQG